MGRIRSMGKMVKGNPGLALGGLAGLGALFGAGSGLREMVTGEKEKRKREAEGQMIALEKRAVALRHAQAMREQAIKLNMQSLALNLPELYNQAAAGRALPRGATYIGGSRRPDVIRDLAEGMANGDFNQQG